MKAIVITLCLLLSLSAVFAQEGMGVLWKKEIFSHSTPALADLNMDEKKEILILSMNGTVLQLDGLGSVNRSFGAGMTALSAPLLIDMYGNGSYEIVFVGPNNVSAYTGDGSVLWTNDLNETIHGGALYLNHSNEVVFGSEKGALYVLDASQGTLKWTMKVSGAIENAPTQADADNDGRTEILLGTDAGNIYDIDRGKGKILVYSIEGGVASTPVGIDIDADGSPEIVAVSRLGNLYALSVPPATSTNSRITEKWNYSANGDSEGSLTLADIDGNGMYESLFGSSSRGQYREDSALYVVSYDGTLIKKYSTRGVAVSSPLVADINGDGKKEIIFGTDKGAFYILNSSLEALWTYELKEPVRTTPAAYDYDGDAKQEILVPTDSALYMIGSIEDNDSDGLTDYAERLMGTNLSNSDTDADGMNDSIDPQPLDSSLKYTDSDMDGLTDYDEISMGTDPLNNDSDGDGIPDAKDPQPRVNELKQMDSDSDGLTDWDEKGLGTDPVNNDTDFDGIPDGNDSEPLRNLLKEIDSDNDTLNDYLEKQMGTDPQKNDTDADGMPDATDPDPLTPAKAKETTTTTTTFPVVYRGQDQSGVIIFVAALSVLLFMVRYIPGRKED